MRVQFDKVNIFYKDIFLEMVALPKAYQLEEITFDNPLIHEYIIIDKKRFKCYNKLI